MSLEAHHSGRECKDRFVFVLMTEQVLYFRPGYQSDCKIEGMPFIRSERPHRHIITTINCKGLLNLPKMISASLLFTIINIVGFTSAQSGPKSLVSTDITDTRDLFFC